MGYRGLTNEQFALIKDAAKKVCLAHNLMTIGDFKRVGNELIDEIETKSLDWGDLLQEEIPYEPKSGSS